MNASTTPIHSSVRRRLVRLVVLASMLALLCVAAAVLLYETTTFRPRSLAQLQNTSHLLLQVLPAALDFGGEAEATSYLRTFAEETQPAVRIAVLYNRQGERFAHYCASNHVTLLPLKPAPAGHQFAARGLSLWQPIKRGSEVLGHLYLSEELPPLHKRLPQYAIMVVTVLLALLVVATVLLRGVQHHFLRPLASLLETTGHVIRHSDYSVCAAISRDDELGQLARAFNQMLHVVGQRDAALREAGTRIQNVFDAATEVAIVAADLKGLITVFNVGAERLLGYAAGEVVGKLTPLVWHDSNEVNIRSAELSRELGRPIQGFQVFVELAQQGQHAAREWTYIRKDGSRVVISLVVTAVRDAQGNLSGFLGVSSDITERKRAEQIIQRVSLLGRQLGAVTDAAAAAQAVADAAEDLLGWDACFLKLRAKDQTEAAYMLGVDTIDGKRQTVVTTEGQEITPTERRVMETGAQLILRENPERAPESVMFGDQNRPSASLMYVPLRHQGRYLGMFSIQSYKRHAYTPADLDLLQTLADHAAGALERLRAETALGESEVRFRELFERSPDAVFVEDEGGTILDANPAACRLLGLSRDTLIGKNVLDTVPPEARETVSREFPKWWSGELAQTEGVCLVADGQHVPVEVRGAVIHYGDQPALLLHVRDITERKRMERARQESEALYRRAIEVAGAVPYLQSYAATAPTVRYEFIGEGIRHMTGYGPEEFSDAVMDSIIEERVLLGELATYSLDDAVQRVRSGLTPIWQCEYRIRARDGQCRWLSEAAVELRDDSGVSHGSLGLLQDITERKQAEERLRQQAALLEATHDAILVWDVEHGVQFMNPAAEELTGRKLAETQSRDLAFALRPRTELSLRAAIQEVLARGSWTGELALLTTAQPRTVASRWTVLADDAGQSTAVLITCNDVTEKKHLENQYLRAQRLESVGTLASGVAHDLNNILSPILMGVEMLSLNPVDEETRSMLAMMKDSARRGRDTVKQLLTFARGTETQKGPVQPRHLLKEIARLLQQTFPKNIQIYTDYTGEPATVLADPSQLHQVLMNLCVNARDAMPEGGVLFLTLENRTLDADTANIHPKARPTMYVVFKVSDSGTGIPPEVVDRIFDPFFTTKPQGKGTGLGLATVLGIVENHGGFVTVESVPSHGTTFQVFLPAGAATDAVGAVAETAALPRGRGELILAVDDEEAILRMVEGVLQRAGYTTLTATSASEALHLYEKHHERIRVVLTDIMMPFGDGRQLITMLYGQNPALPIIAMSGLATSEFQRETLKRGAQAFVAKPFSAEQLIETLGQLLRRDPS